MRILLALALALSLSANAGAVAFKIGYGNAVGTVDEVKEISGIANQQLNVEEDVSHGLIMLGAEVSQPVFGPVSLGIETGIGMAAGDYVMDKTTLHVPVAGSPNQNEGDEVTIVLNAVPVMAKVSAAFPVGPGEIRAGLGLGALLIGWTMEDVNTKWSGGNNNKSTLTELSTSVDTEFSAGTAAVFAAQITPGYHLKVGENGSVGLDIPITIAGERKVKGMERDMTIPGVGDDDPLTQGLTVGGMSWGVNVVYTQRM